MLYILYIFFLLIPFIVYCSKVLVWSRQRYKEHQRRLTLVESVLQNYKNSVVSLYTFSVVSGWWGRADHPAGDISNVS